MSKTKNGVLVLLRHGKSVWNVEKKFTGWIDADIAPEGIEEAHNAAEKLKDYSFNRAYSSVLQRASKTLDIVIEDLKQTDIPILRDKALNERNYGDLQGRYKEDVKAEVGEEQFIKWRRGYDTPPPNGESLKDTAARAIPYLKEKILPHVLQGETVLVSAHGNSLRAIVMDLEKIPPEEVIDLSIPTGVPYIYEIDPKGKIVSKKILN